MNGNPFSDQLDDNPYRPSTALPPVVGLLSDKREDLRAVASAQRGIIMCILVQLILFPTSLFMPPAIHNVLSLIILVVGLVGTVFVFSLATKVYGVGAGIVLGILTLIPCFGFVVLLIINGKATSVLRQNGIHVGLMGADTSKL